MTAMNVMIMSSPPSLPAEAEQGREGHARTRQLRLVRQWDVEPELVHPGPPLLGRPADCRPRTGCGAPRDRDGDGQRDKTGTTTPPNGWSRVRRTAAGPQHWRRPAAKTGLQGRAGVEIRMLGGAAIHSAQGGHKLATRSPTRAARHAGAATRHADQHRQADRLPVVTRRPRTQTGDQPRIHHRQLRQTHTHGLHLHQRRGRMAGRLVTPRFLRARHSLRTRGLPPVPASPTPHNRPTADNASVTSPNGLLDHTYQETRLSRATLGGSPKRWPVEGNPASL